MRAKCVANKPVEGQIEALGEYYRKHGINHDSHLTVGKTYLILGLVINVSFPRMAAGVSLTLLCDYGHVESYPLVLFEIVDGNVDPEWRMRSRPDGIVQVKPELLLGAQFADDYLEGEPDAVRPFKELLKRMQQRAAPDPESTNEAIKGH